MRLSPEEVHNEVKSLFGLLEAKIEGAASQFKGLDEEAKSDFIFERGGRRYSVGLTQAEPLPEDVQKLLETKGIPAPNWRNYSLGRFCMYDGKHGFVFDLWTQLQLADTPSSWEYNRIDFTDSGNDLPFNEPEAVKRAREFINSL